MTNRRFGWSLAMLGLAAASNAQVPDLLTAFDAGNASTGAGGAFNGLAADPSAANWNPAGLAYTRPFTLLVSYRNIPESRSVLGGTYASISRSTSGEKGSSEFSQLAYAVPLSSLFRRASGVLGFSYNVGGTIDDIGVVNAGTVIPVASGLNVTNFRDERHARTEFYTASFGRAVGTGNFSFGFGLTYARQKTSLVQTGNIVDGSGNPAPGLLTLPNIKADGGGVGVIAGLQYSPPTDPNISFGASVRTPISVGSNQLYERIPGRLVLNAAYRLPGLRKSRPDFATVGIQSQTFFGGKRSFYFDRKSSQSAIGIGGEYNLFFGAIRVPLRLGYDTIPSGGDSFSSRQAFTYGLGYRPASNDYSLDANFATVRGGGTDLSFTATYHFR